MTDGQLAYVLDTFVVELNRGRDLVGKRLEPLLDEREAGSLAEGEGETDAAEMEAKVRAATTRDLLKQSILGPLDSLSDRMRLAAEKLRSSR